MKEGKEEKKGSNCGVVGPNEADAWRHFSPSLFPEGAVSPCVDPLPVG